MTRRRSVSRATAPRIGPTGRRAAPVRLIAVGIVAGLGFCSGAGADAVTLRQGGTAFGTVEAMDPGGVSLRRAADRNAPRPAADGPGAQVLDRIGWDRIASIELDGGSDRWPSLPSLLADGERLWRARTRLERGDASLAARAIEGPWSPMSVEGPSAAVSAMVELQVALAAGDHARAVRAQLEALRLRRRGFDAPTLVEWIEPTGSGAFERHPVVDAAIPLCPVLPPFARRDEERAAMLAAIDSFDAKGDRELDAIRLAFAAALDPSRPSVPAPTKGADRGDDSEVGRALELLRAVRDARSADPAERVRGRESLVQARRRWPEWTEAWARFAIGSGWLLDGTPESIRAGQLELLHLPARFARSQPYLAPFAASLAARASIDAGRPEEAQRILPESAPPSRSDAPGAPAETR